MAANDLEILKAWVDRGDANAFRQLVDTHARATYAVCLRILRNPQDAEDITQECFAELARSGGRVEQSVPGWLHRSATRRALNLIRERTRRAGREHAVDLETARESGPASAEIERYLDEEIERLPITLRTIVVKHFLGGESYADIARDLRVTRQAVQERAQRALGQLREGLARRGITASATALSTALAGTASEATSTELMRRLHEIPTAIPPRTVATPNTMASRGAAKPIASIPSAKIWLVASAVAIALVVGFVIVRPPSANAPQSVSNQASVQPSPADSPATDGPAANGALDPNESADRPAGRSQPPASQTRHQTRDATHLSLAGSTISDSNEPVPNAKVFLIVTGLDTHQQILGDPARYTRLLRDPDRRFVTTSDAHGEFLFDDVPYGGRALISAESSEAAGGVTLDLPEQGVEEATIILNQITAARFRLITSNREPVAKAFVQPLGFMLGGAGFGGGGGGSPVVTETDEDGRFTLFLPGAGYTAFHVAAQSGIQRTIGPVSAGSESGYREILLEEPGRVAGRVTQRDGSPASNVLVYLRGTVFMSLRVDAGNAGGAGGFGGTGAVYVVQTDDEGGYRIPNVDPAPEYTIHVVTPSWELLTPQAKLDGVTAGATTTWNEAIDSITDIHGTVTEMQTDTPVADVLVACFAGVERVARAIVTTDADGAFQIRVAVPRNGVTVVPHYRYGPTLNTSGFQPPWQQSQTQRSSFGYYEPFAKKFRKTELGAEPVTLQLPAPASVRVRVYDEDGRPAQNVGVGYSWSARGDGGRSFSPTLGTTSISGTFTATGFAPEGRYFLYTEAEGYFPAHSNEFEMSAGKVHVSEPLHLSLPSGIKGVAFTRDGKPLANAMMFVAYRDGATWQSPNPRRPFQTNAEGRFTARDVLPASAVQVRLSAMQQGGPMLMPWESEPIELPPRDILDLGRVVFSSR